MARKNTSPVVEDKVVSESLSSEERHKKIEQLAYELYCQCGCEHGHDVTHWIEAERHVLDRDKQGHKTNG